MESRSHILAARRLKLVSNKSVFHQLFQFTDPIDEDLLDPTLETFE